MIKLVRSKGFTIVELLIVIAVLAVLAVIAIVSYSGIQRRSANTLVYKDLRSAAEQLGLSYVRSPKTSFSSLDNISEDMRTSGDVILQLVSGYTGPYYENLSPVQNGVLFYEVCEELIADPLYSEIHSADGNQAQSVVMKCTDNIGDDVLKITGWDPKDWETPVTKEALQTYINSVPYDSWWVDRQSVVRGFYSELIQRFEARGGVFPITSFWEPDANPWWGIPKEELPSPTTPPGSGDGSFCVEAYHARFPEGVYKITDSERIETGSC